MRIIVVFTILLILVVATSINASAEEKIDIHRDLVPYDLTRGKGLRHASLAKVQKLYKDIMGAFEFFRGARESQSSEHILKLADDIIPDLQGGLEDTCQPIHNENHQIDTDSLQLRNRVRELSEQFQNSASSSNKALLEEMTVAGKALGENEDKFSHVHSLHAMCNHAQTKIEQLAGEAAFAKHAVEAEKSGLKASMDL